MEAGAAVTAITSRIIFSNIISLLFPLRCVHCGREGASLCQQCMDFLEPMEGIFCGRCGGSGAGDSMPASGGSRVRGSLPINGSDSCPECAGRQLHFRRARAAFAYEGPSRSMVHALKFRNQRRTARIMAEASCEVSDVTGFVRGATLVPVPMHHVREYERGYNHAALYARALADSSGAGYEELLTRTRITSLQNRLGFQQRRNNPNNSIALRSRGRTGSNADTHTDTGNGRVVLVDDVYTTGSTASECARVLRQGLGVEVDVWTFARTVKRWSKDMHFPMGV